ncbi:hypothetical protein [Cellulomonas composti]|nr:hypothetical protein [Cellulomonas composti]
MGSRAGIVVIDADGGVELFYDHWAAQRLAQDAALAGFRSTLERVRSMSPMGEPSVAEWSSATWMEGSMLIDVPNHRLVWAEEGDGLVLPRIANHLIERTWPGWTAIWSPAGVAGIIHLAGADPAPLFAQLRTLEREHVADNPWFTPRSDHMCPVPLSVRLEDGDVVLWGADTDLSDIACYGPDEIVAVARRARDDGSVGDGWGKHWLPAEMIADDDWPGWGLHLDTQKRELFWWATWEHSPRSREFATYWPGWDVHTIGDAWEQHESELDGVQLEQPWAGHVAEARRNLLQLHAEGVRENPFTRVARGLTAQGHDAAPLPAVLEFVPNRGFAGLDLVLSALDDLAAGPPLRPARFVDLQGVIHDP